CPRSTASPQALASPAADRATPAEPSLPAPTPRSIAPRPKVGTASCSPTTPPRHTPGDPPERAAWPRSRVAGTITGPPSCRAAMKTATWNVNSLKVRLPHVLDWLASEQPDVLCLQELKMEDAAFPRAEIEAAGYQAVFNGQKTYNGVAILSRQAPAAVIK